jgi:hypothetical protein
MRGRIAQAIFLAVPALLLANALHSWTWFFAVFLGEILLLCWAATFGRSNKRDITPQELADELERHLVGNEDHTIGARLRRSRLPMKD